MAPPQGSPQRFLMKSQLFGKPPPLSDIDLSGQTAIITGASTGIGYHSCVHFLTHQLSHLILAVRSTTKGEAAASKLRTQFPSAKIEVWSLEMTSYESIQTFARKVETDLTRLDIVILNAGIVKPEFVIVESTGHEEVFQVNYLSTVLLSILILPLLKTKSPPSVPGRLSIVNSGTSFVATFPNRHSVPLLKSFDVKAERDAHERYPCSKLLSHYYIVKLANYVNPKDVIVNLVDPGLTKGSSFMRELTGLVSIAFGVAKATLGRSQEVSSSAYIYAAAGVGEESHCSLVFDWKITS
jgi:NAD(P)-dependent dehydrogenase (short-subunit alcohol dehydrogenase family)